jgi:putative FmdB family regulatory protein
MPLYEYRCDACGGRFEVIQKFSETSKTCRLCGQGPVERLQSAPGFQFKGSGWYVTDYAQKGKAEGGSSAAGKGDAATSGEPKSTDTGSTEKPSKTESTTAASSSASSPPSKT